MTEPSQTLTPAQCRALYPFRYKLPDTASYETGENAFLRALDRFGLPAVIITGAHPHTPRRRTFTDRHWMNCSEAFCFRTEEDMLAFVLMIGVAE